MIMQSPFIWNFALHKVCSFEHVCRVFASAFRFSSHSTDHRILCGWRNNILFRYDRERTLCMLKNFPGNCPGTFWEGIHRHGGCFSLNHTHTFEEKQKLQSQRNIASRTFLQELYNFGFVEAPQRTWGVRCFLGQQIVLYRSKRF